MSVVFVVVPIVAAGWPIISAAIGSACAALGYSMAKQSESARERERETLPVGPLQQSIEMEMANAEVISDTMAREQVLQYEKDGVLATFKKDARGHLSLHVGGTRSEAELAAVGQQILNRVRQQFAYERVKQELTERGYTLVEEQVEANENIRISVRRFQ
jgi:hypothetical protein